MGRLSAAAMIVLAIPALAAAQHRGGMAAPPTAPSFHAGTVISRAASIAAHPTMRVQSGTQSAALVGTPVLRARSSGVRIIHRNNSAFELNGTDFQDVPGLGFDFPHLAAISGNRHRHGPRFFDLVPFGFGGFLLSPSVIVEQMPAAESQPVVVEEEIADDAPEVQRPARHARTSREVSDSQPESSLTPTPAPKSDVEQFVFVRRDGGLVFAVAYAWENNTLRYVTPEGLRRSLGRDALDLDATQQFNEQRGLNFRAPA